MTADDVRATDNAALCPCGEPAEAHLISTHSDAERLVLAVFGDDTTQAAIEQWADRDLICGEVEVQGFDVVMECIRPAHHEPDYHQTNIGQRWVPRTVAPTVADSHADCEVCPYSTPQDSHCLCVHHPPTTPGGAK